MKEELQQNPFARMPAGCQHGGMAAQVHLTTDARDVLDVAGGLLGRDPVLHNVILTLLHARAASPEPGRYWIVELDGAVAGVVFQSPLHYIATITPMPADAVAAAVDAIVREGIRLPGVSGDADTAARFAGQWTERAKTGGRPTQGQRIYEVGDVIEPRATTGHVRLAVPEEQDLLVAWFRAFQADIGDTVTDSTHVVRQRIAAGHLSIWDDDGPAALAGVFGAVSGVARVGPVYTPDHRRGNGYASALVAAVSRATLANGQRCILYTDLENPTSNAIYRAIGYRAVAEALRYRFGDEV